MCQREKDGEMSAQWIVFHTEEGSYQGTETIPFLPSLKSYFLFLFTLLICLWKSVPGLFK